MQRTDRGPAPLRSGLLDALARHNASLVNFGDVDARASLAQRDGGQAAKQHTNNVTGLNIAKLQIPGAAVLVVPELNFRLSSAHSIDVRPVPMCALEGLCAVLSVQASAASSPSAGAASSAGVLARRPAATWRPVNGGD